MSFDPSLSVFAPHLGTAFRVCAADSPPIELNLVEATDKGSVPSQEQFSLIFRGPNEVPLEQSTYTLEHELLGAIDIFLVPVAKDGAGRLYEAYYNLLR
jgi:hypothetical protein